MLPEELSFETPLETNAISLGQPDASVRACAVPSWRPGLYDRKSAHSADEIICYQKSVTFNFLVIYHEQVMMFTCLVTWSFPRHFQIAACATSPAVVSSSRPGPWQRVRALQDQFYE